MLGTTLYGGFPFEQGCGTVFELLRQIDRGFNERVLHRFEYKAGDGCFPKDNLVGDGTGALYGTTFQGGNLNCQFNGCGTIFKPVVSDRERKPP